MLVTYLGGLLLLCLGCTLASQERQAQVTFNPA
jgi:hypothetical protein